MSDEQLLEFRVTFGQMYRREPHPLSPLAHPDGWVSVMAPDEDAARARIVQEFGRFWAFIYGPFEQNSVTGAYMHEHLYPRGRMATLTAGATMSEPVAVEVVTRYGGFRHLADPKPLWYSDPRHFTRCSGTSSWSIDEWAKNPDHPLGLTAAQMTALPLCRRCEDEAR